MSAATVEAAHEPFNRRTLFWGIFASLLAAAGFFLLSTYAPDFRLGPRRRRDAAVEGRLRLCRAWRSC